MSTLVWEAAVAPVSVSTIFGMVKQPPHRAESSRARPTWEKQSVRLLVTSTSRTCVGPLTPAASAMDSTGRPPFMGASAAVAAAGTGDKYSAIQSSAIFIHHFQQSATKL